MTRFFSLAVTFAVLGMGSAALAEPHHSAHGGGFAHGYTGAHHAPVRHHGGSNVYVSFGNSGGYYRPGFYRPYPNYGYYPQQTFVYAQPPVPVSSLPVYEAPAAQQDADNEDGRYCREFQKPITVGGVAQAGYGRACMQPDGSWEIVS